MTTMDLLRESFDNQDEQCDIKLFIGDQLVVKSHNLILQLQSDYFKSKNTFNHNLRSGAQKQENHIFNNLNQEALKVCLTFMYTDDIDWETGSLSDIVQVASYLQMPNLLKCIAAHISTELDEESCVLHYQISSHYVELGVVDTMLNYIDSHFTSLLQSAAALNLTGELIRGIISRQTLSARENEIFEFLDMWCQHNGKTVDIFRNDIRFLQVSIQGTFNLFPESVKTVITKCLLAEELEQPVPFSPYLRDFIVDEQITGIERMPGKKKSPNSILSSAIPGDSIIFSSNCDCTLKGIGIFTEPYSLIHLELGIVNNDTEVSANKLSFIARNEVSLVHIEPCMILSNTNYTIYAHIRGHAYKGLCGVSKVVAGDISMSFKDVQIMGNSTTTSKGQFPIIFVSKR